MFHASEGVLVITEETIFETNDDYSDDIYNLIYLSNNINSIIEENQEKGIKDEIVELRASIDCAMDLLLKYEDEKDEDSKHDFGFEYSELIVDIGEQLEEINKLGISLYLH